MMSSTAFVARTASCCTVAHLGGGGVCTAVGRALSGRSGAACSPSVPRAACARWRGVATVVSASAHKGQPTKAADGWNLVDQGARREWQRPDLHLVLVCPQIPQNTGNVARTCAATGVALHLVGPLGFELDSAKLKRAGLDYWDWVAAAVHDDWDAFASFFDAIPGPKRMVAFSKLGRCHHAAEGLYVPGASNWLVFGAETTGLPPEALETISASGGVVAKIPMSNFEHVRSLNLATSAGVGVFEALRQLDGAVLPEASLNAAP
jgi:tRNA (cytidine/uridine-2'-O-)-methyltransferase